MQHQVSKRNLSRKLTLRTFFAVLVIFAILLGQFILSAQRQRKVVDWCQNQGGYVVYDSDYDFNKHVSTGRTQPPKWYHSNPFRDFFSSVAYVRVHAENSDYSPIENLKKLDRLEIYNIAQSDFRYIDQLGRLSTLHISGQKVDDLGPLSALTSVKQLGLTDIAATDLRPLTALQDLQFVSLTDCNIKDFSPLTRLTDLQLIAISSTPIDDAEVDELKAALPKCTIQLLNRSYR